MKNCTQVYYIDRIKILCRAHYNEVKQVLDSIIEHDSRVKGWVNTAKSKLKIKGFKDVLDLRALTLETLLELIKYEDELGNYCIQYLEVSEDTILQSDEDAVKAFEKEMKLLKCKRKREYHVFNGKDDLSDYVRAPEFLHDKTLYIRNRNSTFRMYARISKINNKPCLHKEFTANNAEEVKKRGIYNLSDIVSKGIDSVYKDMGGNMLVKVKFDYYKIGLWYKNIDGRRRRVQNERKRIEFYGRLFIRRNKINSYTDFHAYIKRMKIGLAADCKRWPSLKLEAKKFEKAWKNIYSFFIVVSD